MKSATKDLAVLWDMDGTLVDTAELHFAAWVRLMGELERPFTRADFTATATGVSYSGAAEWSFRRFILHHARLAEAAEASSLAAERETLPSRTGPRRNASASSRARSGWTWSRPSARASIKIPR